MARKIAALIVVAAVTAAALLSMRQQRLRAAHELAEAHQRAVEHRHRVWRLRAEIARRTTPDRIALLVERSQQRLVEASPRAEMLRDSEPPALAMWPIEPHQGGGNAAP